MIAWWEYCLQAPTDDDRSQQQRRKGSSNSWGSQRERSLSTPLLRYCAAFLSTTHRRSPNPRIHACRWSMPTILNVPGSDLNRRWWSRRPFFRVRFLPSVPETNSEICFTKFPVRKRTTFVFSLRFLKFNETSICKANSAVILGQFRLLLTSTVACVFNESSFS